MIHLPRHASDIAGSLAFWLGGLWVLCYEFFFVLSFYHYHNIWNFVVFVHLAAAAVLSTTIYMTMFMMISTDASVKSIKAPQLDPPITCSWPYCDKCQCNVPPRSHHCKLCDVCILKRDHHCWFAGYCVGFSNHRYYFALTFYITVASIYCNVYNWDYVMAMKGGFTWTTIPGFLAPHVGLIFGYYSAFEFFITLNTSTGFFCMFMFTYLFATQLSLIYKGQVQYEKKKGILTYSMGPRENFREVLGTAGLCGFICPLIPSKLSCDGTTFSLKGE